MVYTYWNCLSIFITKKRILYFENQSNKQFCYIVFHIRYSKYCFYLYYHTGAVVTREYGLPCVTGMRDATKRFNTGTFKIFPYKFRLSYKNRTPF